MNDVGKIHSKNKVFITTTVIMTKLSEKRLTKVVRKNEVGLRKSKCMVAHYSIEKPGLSKLSAQTFL